MVVRVNFDTHEKVQLWENGPYWATTNIGAERPEEYGYYFWWGDTVGYKRENNAWVATDGSSTNFFFTQSHTPTASADPSTLLSWGWVVLKDGTYVLVAEHDAAYVQWGGGWRMPTKAELSALHDNCTWTGTSLNGVKGYRVNGKGDYASNNIFLPAAGLVEGISPRGTGSTGYYWSSVPLKSYSGAWYLYFGSEGLYVACPDYGGFRALGIPVRPVQGSTE